MRINNNIVANKHRQGGVGNTTITKTTEEVSCGQGSNRPADDAAGPAISEKMRAQIRGLQMAAQDSQAAIFLVRAVEAALCATHDTLQKMRELALLSATAAAAGGTDHDAWEQEFKLLLKQLDEQAGAVALTEDGSRPEQALQDFLGAKPAAAADDDLFSNIGGLDAQGLGLEGCRITDRAAAAKATAQVSSALSRVSTKRVALGILQNRLEYEVSSLDISAENLRAAGSRILDMDMAKEMLNFTRKNILAQAATAILAQANSSPQDVPKLVD